MPLEGIDRLVCFHPIHEPGDIIALNIDGEAVKVLGEAIEAVSLLSLDRDAPLEAADAVLAAMDGVGDVLRT